MHSCSALSPHDSNVRLGACGAVLIQVQIEDSRSVLKQLELLPGSLFWCSDKPQASFLWLIARSTLPALHISLSELLSTDFRVPLTTLMSDDVACPAHIVK